MKDSKSNPIKAEAIRLADISKALSHPIRILILNLLAEKNTCICSEIVDQLPLSQSTVSQHLKELKRVGLIEGEVEGPKTCYYLNTDVLEQARTAFSNLFSTICD